MSPVQNASFIHLLLYMIHEFDLARFFKENKTTSFVGKIPQKFVLRVVVRDG